MATRILTTDSLTADTKSVELSTDADSTHSHSNFDSTLSLTNILNNDPEFPVQVNQMQMNVGSLEQTKALANLENELENTNNKPINYDSTIERESDSSKVN